MNEEDRKGCLALICIVVLVAGVILLAANVSNTHKVQELRAYHPELVFEVHPLWGIRVQVGEGWVDWEVYQDWPGGVVR